MLSSLRDAGLTLSSEPSTILVVGQCIFPVAVWLHGVAFVHCCWFDHGATYSKPSAILHNTDSIHLLALLSANKDA